MKKNCLIIFSLLFFYGAFTAQNNRVVAPKKKVAVDNNNLTTTTVAKPASESLYFGYENKIMEFSIGNSIPSGFPTNVGFKTRESYRDAINKWMKENDAFVKPDYKNKTITD